MTMLNPSTDFHENVTHPHRRTNSILIDWKKTEGNLRTLADYSSNKQHKSSRQFGTLNEQQEARWSNTFSKNLICFHMNAMVIVIYNSLHRCYLTFHSICQNIGYSIQRCNRFFFENKRSAFILQYYKMLYMIKT